MDLNTAMGHTLDTNESIAQAVVAAATAAEAVMIITLTSSGNSARLISKCARNRYLIRLQQRIRSYLGAPHLEARTLQRS